MIPAERSHLHVAAKTHEGMSGKNNEDRYAVSAFRLEDAKSSPVVFAIVSDGIGGHRAGEVAAEMAVEEISRIVAASDAHNPVDTLRQGIIQASQQILAYSVNDNEKKGMGATCACAWIIDDRLYIAYVGDSRVYLVRGDSIRQLSIDHTWIQDAIHAGILTPEQAQGHPNAHVIRRYLGSQQTVEPDTRLRLRAEESDAQSEANQGLVLLPGDHVILCSDGLTDLVKDNEILSMIKNYANQSEALDKLVDLANQRGGHDNITVVALGIPAPEPTYLDSAPTLASKSSAASPRAKRRYWMGVACLGTLILVVVLAALAGGAYWFLNREPTATVSPSPVLTASPVIPTLPEIAPTESVITTAIPAIESTVAPTSTISIAPATAQPTLPVAETAAPGGATPTYTAWPTNTTNP